MGLFNFLFGRPGPPAGPRQTASNPDAPAGVLTADLRSSAATHFLVATEVREADTHAAVSALLGRWGATRLLASLWLVQTDRSILELRDAVRETLGDDDALAVVELQPGAWWACENAENQGLEWLRQRVLA
jgi:hypothetical protein